ncbi:MAG: hypothetical protein OES47_14985, partial [Acidobacteriota bacterium]|nr:hypothetical protein [Acidobacteriota bacterium]
MSGRNRAWIAAVAIVTIGVLAGSQVGAAGTTIRLATLIPDGSIWDKALKQMGDSWRKASEGRVSLRVYPGT